MYIPLSDDKHQKVRDNFKKHTGNPRQIQSETKFSLRIFSQWLGKNFFFQTEFCLGLHLSQTEFCLGLHTAVVFRMQSFNFYIGIQRQIKITIAFDAVII